MGSPAEIVLVYPPASKIYLYTHWWDYEWPERLRQALLKGRPRWHDEQYLGRFIISQVFKDIQDDLTGGGVSTESSDGPQVFCDLGIQQVWYEGQQPHQGLSFSSFVAQEEADWPDRIKSWK